MKKTLLVISCVLSALLSEGRAQSFWKGLDYSFRIGYSIGGTIPVGMPASIRQLNSFTLTNNLQLGADSRYMWTRQWGASVGIRFENKGMSEDAEVKDYRMEIVRGGETLAGRFTGDVKTRVAQWMFTVPVRMSYTVGQFRLDAGPYFSYLLSPSFEGYAHDGYLRVTDPTGPKILVGGDERTKGRYDFSSDMRHWQWGIGLGAEWSIGKKTGVYADINWGLSGIHHSGFKTIEQTLYPVYGTLGVILHLDKE